MTQRSDRPVHSDHVEALQAKWQKLHSSPAWQSALQGAPVALPSPCIQVCTLDAQQQYCVGCLRTLQELSVWSKAQPQQQCQIWQTVMQRCKEAQAGGGAE